jgi:hypothetical protein
LVQKEVLKAPRDVGGYPWVRVLKMLDKGIWRRNIGINEIEKPPENVVFSGSGFEKFENFDRNFGDFRKMFKGFEY